MQLTSYSLTCMYGMNYNNKHHKLIVNDQKSSECFLASMGVSLCTKVLLPAPRHSFTHSRTQLVTSNSCSAKHFTARCDTYDVSVWYHTILYTCANFQSVLVIINIELVISLGLSCPHTFRMLLPPTDYSKEVKMRSRCWDVEAEGNLVCTEGRNVDLRMEEIWAN